MFLGLQHPCRGNGGSAGYTPPLQAATWELKPSASMSTPRLAILHPEVRAYVQGMATCHPSGKRKPGWPVLTSPQCSACPLETREGSCPHGSCHVRETVTDAYASWSSWKLKITRSPSQLAMRPATGPCAHSTAPKSGTSLGCWEGTPLPSGVRSWLPFLSVPVAATASSVHTQGSW